MSNIYQGTLGLIGNTPLVELTHVEKAYGLEARLLAKLEYFNPAGSVKDRIAKEMIEQERKEVLDAKVSDIRALADIVEAVLKAGDLCVVGSEEKIEAQKELFMEIKNLA